MDSLLFRGFSTQCLLATAMVMYPVCVARPVRSTPLQVSDVLLVDVSHQALILLSEPGSDRVIPVWSDALSGAKVAAQLHHDAANHLTLAQDVVRGLGGHILRVCLDGIHDAEVTTHLEVQQGSRQVWVSVDPADALELALNAGLPIVATPRVIASAVAPEDAKRIAQPDPGGSKPPPGDKAGVLSF